MITNVPNWQTKTPQQILDYLNESVWVPNNQAVTVAIITATVGLQNAGLVLGTIDAASVANPLLKSSFIALSTTGMGLSSPERQGMIDQLAVAGSWPNEVRDAVKALGGTNQPRWQALGTEPTLESVTTEYEIRTRINNLAALRDRWLSLSETILTQINAGTLQDSDVIASVTTEWGE